MENISDICLGPNIPILQLYSNSCTETYFQQNIHRGLCTIKKMSWSSLFVQHPGHYIRGAFWLQVAISQIQTTRYAYLPRQRPHSDVTEIQQPQVSTGLGKICSICWVSSVSPQFSLVYLIGEGNIGREGVSTNPQVAEFPRHYKNIAAKYPVRPNVHIFVTVVLLKLLCWCILG